MKDETKLKLLFITAVATLFFVLYISLFVMLPGYESAKLEVFKDNKEMKRGVIILVIPNDAVYFKDGSIMKQWQREDYGEFRKHIGMEVTITYGELEKYTMDYGGKKLFSIVETPVGDR